MSRQLALDLPPRANFTREGFIVTGANRDALRALDGWRAWPGGKMLLIGPGGAGKSHLAHVWAGEADALMIEGADLARLGPERAAARHAVVVENAALAAGRPEFERALFHLHNLLRPEGEEPGHLLITASTAPRDWGVRLPDLLSRLQAAPVTRLALPDDALLSGVLGKLFTDRQLDVSDELIPYLVARMPRSIAAARRIVEAIDRQSLAGRRRPGPRLAAEILARLDEEG